MSGEEADLCVEEAQVGAARSVLALCRTSLFPLQSFLLFFPFPNPLNHFFLPFLPPYIFRLSSYSSSVTGLREGGGECRGERELERRKMKS